MFKTFQELEETKFVSEFLNFGEVFQNNISDIPLSPILECNYDTACKKIDM